MIGLPGPLHAACALALDDCRSCFGSGKRMGKRFDVKLCHCVERRVFDDALRRYHLNQVRIEHGIGPTRSRRVRAWSYPAIEYLADFENAALRALRKVEDGERHWKVFRLHLLEGQQWMHLAPRLGLTRGNFFHTVYRVKQRVGRALLEARLHPYDAYRSASSPT